MVILFVLDVIRYPFFDLEEFFHIILIFILNVFLLDSCLIFCSVKLQHFLCFFFLLWIYYRVAIIITWLWRQQLKLPAKLMIPVYIPIEKKYREGKVKSKIYILWNSTQMVRGFYVKEDITSIIRIFFRSWFDLSLWYIPLVLKHELRSLMLWRVNRFLFLMANRNEIDCGFILQFPNILENSHLVGTRKIVTYTWIDRR